MSMNDSQANGSQYGSGAEGSTDPPARLEAVPVEPVASGSTENASILPDQQISAPENGQNVNPGPFSSPLGRGRGSFRGRFRGTMANPYEFFDLNTRGGRGRFSSNRAPYQWESVNNNQNHQNAAMEYNASNETALYSMNFPALQQISQLQQNQSINPSRINLGVTANNQNTSNEQIYNNQHNQNQNHPAVPAVPMSAITLGDFTPTVPTNIRNVMDPQNTLNNIVTDLSRNTPYVYNAYTPSNYINNNNSVNGQINRTSNNELSAQNRLPFEENTNSNDRFNLFHNYPNSEFFLNNPNFSNSNNPNSIVGNVPASNEPRGFGNGNINNLNSTPASGNLPNLYTPSQVSNHSYNSINNQLTPQQSTLFQMSNRQLVEIDNKVRAIDRIRIQDFLRLTNENVHEFSVWQKRFELQMTINDIEFTIRTDFRLGANIEWPTPTDGVFQNCPQLLQALITACKAEEKCQLKAIAKTMAILIYVLTDSKSMQLVHNVTVDTRPNELYGAVIRLHMNVTINKRMGAIKKLYQIEKRPGETNTEFILRLERTRDELLYVYNHSVTDIELIAFLERALEGDMKVAFLTWCGLENATYARFRQQVIDKDDSSSRKSESAMVAFNNRGRGYSRSRSRSSSQSPNRSTGISPFRNSRFYSRYNNKNETRSRSPFRRQSNGEKDRSRDGRRAPESRERRSLTLSSSVGERSIQNVSSRDSSRVDPRRPYEITRHPRASSPRRQDGHSTFRQRSRSHSPSGRSDRDRSSSRRSSSPGYGEVSARANLAEYRGNVYTDSDNLNQNEAHNTTFTPMDHSTHVNDTMQNLQNMHRNDGRDENTFGSVNSVRFSSNNDVIGFVSTAAASTSSSEENRPTLSDNLRLADDHGVIGYANVVQASVADDQPPTTQFQQLSLEDRNPIIIGHCNMMFGGNHTSTEDLYGHLSLRQLLDNSLAPMPTTGNVHIWSVNPYKRFTVTCGTYLAGIASNRCQIRWNIHGTEIWYIEAYFCRWCGKLLEDCEQHEEARWLTGRERNDMFRRVFRLPRVELCQTPLY